MGVKALRLTQAISILAEEARKKNIQVAPAPKNIVREIPARVVSYEKGKPRPV